jgi:hypothetical protein
LEDDREVHRHQHQDQVIQRETPDENEVIDPDLNQQRVQTNKWLAKKMQFQQPDIRKEIDIHRTIIRE